MKKVTLVIIDILKSFSIGILSGSVTGLIFTLTGLLSQKGILLEAMYIGRASVLVIGGLGLLVSSVFFLKKDGGFPLENEDGWRKHFNMLSFRYVLLVFFIGIVIIGGVLDSLIYKLL
jgi:hypothetical protein